MKKVLSTSLTIALTSVNLVTSAKAATNYADWMPVEKNVNIITNYSGGAINGFTGSSVDGTVYTMTRNYTASHGWRLFGGNRLAMNVGAENSTTYVVKTKVKNTSTDGSTPIFNTGLCATGGAVGYEVYPNEYNGFGKGLTLNNDWQEYKATITTGADYLTNNSNSSYRNIL